LQAKKAEKTLLALLILGGQHQAGRAKLAA